MSTRISQLEDALQIEYGMHSQESHPLMSRELLSIKNIQDFSGGHSMAGDEISRPDGTIRKDKDEDGELATAMGVLSLSKEGTPRYFGSTGLEVRDPPWAVLYLCFILTPTHRLHCTSHVHFNARLNVTSSLFGF